MMRKKRLLSVAMLSLLPLLLLVQPVVGQECQSCGKPSNAFGVAPSGESKTLLIKKGQGYGPVSLVAYGLGVDTTYTIIAIGVGQLTILVEDCCIMGDTMFVSTTAKLLGFPKEASDEQTSPANPSVAITVIGIAVIQVEIGYSACPGGFPAGYDVTITFS